VKVVNRGTAANDVSRGKVTPGGSVTMKVHESRKDAAPVRKINLLSVRQVRGLKTAPRSRVDNTVTKNGNH